jgi:hypothetical protein
VARGERRRRSQPAQLNSRPACSSSSSAAAKIDLLPRGQTVSGAVRLAR